MVKNTNKEKGKNGRPVHTNVVTCVQTHILQNNLYLENPIQFAEKYTHKNTWKNTWLCNLVPLIVFEW